MTRRYTPFSVPLFLLTVFLALPAAAGTVYDGSKQPEMLWVQTAAAISHSGDELTLHGVPGTVYFSDRPYRLYGHMTNSEFAEQVMKLARVDPPNAALSTLGGEDVVILELLEAPVVTGGERTVTWKVRLLSGQLPDRVGPGTLFIDPPVAAQITD